ncbi:MAG: aspartate aminotransferase family protein [Acidimicrobiia bacterium]
MSPTAFLHPYASPASDNFVTIARGEGAVVFDDEGNRYVDAMASLWYCNVGHGRTEIADAVADQMKTLEAYQTFDIFTNEPAERICTELAGLAPMPGARVFLTSSGSEAVDSGIKLARIAQARRGEPQRTVVVGRTYAYHGVTYGGLSAQGLPANQEGFGPLLPEVEHVDNDDITALEKLFANRGDEIAVVLAEPVIGAGGVRPPVPGYLAEVRRLCDAHGAYLLFDEVICGFGRLGQWWGAQFYDVQPDLVTFAKGVTSGYVPLGGVLVGQAVRDALEGDAGFILRHGHTYSGHPTACSAGLAALEITKREDLLSRAAPIGARLSQGFDELLDAGDVVDVRGEGAVWAVELPNGVSAIDVRRAMLERGVISRPIVNALAFCPPLVIEDADLDKIVVVLGEAVKAA